MHTSCNVMTHAKPTQKIQKSLMIQWIVIPTSSIKSYRTLWTNLGFDGCQVWWVYWEQSVDTKELCSCVIFFNNVDKGNANDFHPEINQLTLHTKKTNNPTADVGKSGCKANSHRHSPSPLSALCCGQFWRRQAEVLFAWCHTLHR